MNMFGTVIGILIWVVSICLTCYLAKKKGRNIVSWLVLSLFFSWIALIIIVCLKPKSVQMDREPVIISQNLESGDLRVQDKEINNNYASGNDYEVANEEELKKLIMQAKQGDVNAMVIVADCYKRGLYTEKNDQESHKYYKMAADKGHIRANSMAAIDCLYGVGTVEDKKTGIKYLQVAADGGVAFAQFLLATMYQSGDIGTVGKEQKALKYFEMAAKQGDAKSQVELARLIRSTGRYTLDDEIFWLACAYLHRINNQAEEESNFALQMLNSFISTGIPGGRARIEKVLDDVKRNYSMYLRNPF